MATSQIFEITTKRSLMLQQQIETMNKRMYLIERI